MRNFIAVVSSLFFILFSYYFFMPTFAFGFVGWYFVLLFVSLILLVSTYTTYDHEDYPILKIGGWVGISISIIFIIIIPIFTTWGLFRHDDYRNLLGKVEQREFTKDITPIDPKNIVIIDVNIAHKVADKKISDNPNLALGSEVEIGEMTLQKVNGKLYYIAPLLHTSYWKYSENKGGTIGYMKVSALNDNDVDLIQSVKGEPIHLKYQTGACFTLNLQRHLYLNGYSGVGLDDFSFEVDEDGYPYWVVSKYEKTIGYSGNSITATILVNPSTGEIKEYTIENTPKWVDRIQPKEIVIEQINDWGYYVHDYIDFSDKDRLQATDGTCVVFNEDGECYFYTGLSSVGKDESSVGFMLVNTRTKKAFYYKMSGATEDAAMASARGKVQEKGYTTTYPRPYNINGELSYVMALKDGEGLIKMVAIVNIKNYGIVGVGESIEDALRDYRMGMAKNNSLVLTSSSIKNETKGIIERIHSNVVRGETIYYFTLKGSNYIFTASMNVSYKIVLTESKDSVYVIYGASHDGIVDVNSFDNKNIKTNVNVVQVKQEKYFKEVKYKKDSIAVEKAFNNKMQSLSREQKEVIINQQ